MPFDFRGMMAGLASPEAAASSYFQTRELAKRLKIEQEAKDAAADKAKEDERMEIAAAVGPEEIAPGVTRPSYTNAAMLQAQRTSAPVQESANRFTTARAVAPYTKELGVTSSEAALSTNRAADAQQRLQADNANIELGMHPERVARQSTAIRKDIAVNRAGVTAAENQGEKDRQELLNKIPQLTAAFQAGKLTLGNRETTAQMTAGVPEKAAAAAAAKADLDTQESDQNRITGKLSERDMKELGNLQVALQKATGGNMIAKAEAEKAVNSIKTGAINGAIDPVTREVDWEKLGITSKEVIELTMGYLKGGNMMQNWLGGLVGGMGMGSNDNPYARPSTAEPWRRPPPAPAPGPKVGQKTNPFETMKSVR